VVIMIAVAIEEMHVPIDHLETAPDQRMILIRKGRNTRNDRPWPVKGTSVAPAPK
jgi:hypothetical protein